MDISEFYKIYQEHPVVTTDSRNCPEGSIFIALKGASFDGNKFAEAALEKGCAYAVVDEKEYCKEGDERFIDNFQGTCARASSPVRHSCHRYHRYEWKNYY